MAKKAIDPQTEALNALAAILADPAPRVLFGTASVPGFFKGSTQAVKAAAKLCEERQWLVGTGEWVGKGASKKQKYRLTPAGVQAVLDNSPSTVLLQGLASAVRHQSDGLTTLRDQLGVMIQQFQPLTEAVTHLARKMEPPDVERIVRTMHNPDPAAPATAPGTLPASPDWLDTVLNRVTEQRQRDRYQPLSLPQLFAALKAARPALTLGQFHDGLRTLRDQGRIRLAPYTRALATIDDPRNALFLDGEVMYYVELP